MTAAVGFSGQNRFSVPETVGRKDWKIGAARVCQQGIQPIVKFMVPGGHGIVARCVHERDNISAFA